MGCCLVGLREPRMGWLDTVCLNGVKWCARVNGPEAGKELLEKLLGSGGWWCCGQCCHSERSSSANTGLGWLSRLVRLPPNSFRPWKLPSNPLWLAGKRSDEEYRANTSLLLLLLPLLMLCGAISLILRFTSYTPARLLLLPLLRYHSLQSFILLKTMWLVQEHHLVHWWEETLAGSPHFCSCFCIVTISTVTFCGVMRH